MKVSKLFTRLSIGALLSTVITVAANPAQAASLTTINFDEVNVGLEKEDNPLEGGQSIDKLWSSYGLEMSSNRNALWLYDSSVKGGNDDDLLTGKGQYKHKGNTIEYNSPDQGNVLIIQEDHQKDFQKIDKEIKALEKKKNLTSKQQKQLKNKIKKRDTYFRPDDNIGGKMTFDFTDEAGVLFDSIGLLDFDERVTSKIKFGVKFVDDIDFRAFGVGHDFVSSVDILSFDKNGKEILDDNSIREYNFDFGEQKVSEFYIDLPGSGAVTGLSYYREKTKKLARKVPEPTSILGLVAISGLAASSLKRKRKSSDI